MKRDLVIHFARFGPYHFTRLRSATEVLGPLGWRVIGVQTAGMDATYAWDQTGLDSARLVTVFPDHIYEEIPAAKLRRGMMSMLDQLKPDAVAIAGWGTSDARAALDWCRKNGANAIVMSETRASDGDRRWWKEWLKGRLLRRFDGALVGGKAHKDYLEQLGMSEERIRIGYDVVDNGHFARESAKWRTKGSRDEGAAQQEVAVESEETRAHGAEDRGRRPDIRDQWSEGGGQRSEDIESGSVFALGGASGCLTDSAQQGGEAGKSEGSRLACSGERRPYFLASSRFIERKNLRQLLDAYADYRGSFQCSVGSVQSDKEQRKPWDLVLLGTGDGREELERYVEEKGIEGVVFAGFQQIDALPRWYAGAGAFVHPALEEPWGLVINEAMACGLPVICSWTTGAAELVEESVNGFLFDPRDKDGLINLLLRVATMSPEERQRLGENSRRLIEEKLPVTAFGAGLAKLLGCVPS